jgi:hypothetical protein
MTSDPERERQRLAQLYAAMTPEELENITCDAASLTDIARDALKTEITRRGLTTAMGHSPVGTDVVEARDLVLIRQLLPLPEALLARSRLESAGIECFMADDNMVRINWPNLLGGVKLLVSQEDAPAAAAILDEPIPETPNDEAVE